MFILNCCYAEKSWLMHDHLRFCADMGRNALILCSASFYLGKGRFWRASFRLDLLRGSSLGCRIVL
jgi:hypothetical protein